MSRDRRGHDDDRAALDAAMKGVRPIRARNSARPPPTGSAAARPSPADTAVEFEIVRAGERIEARAPGIDRKHLRRLRTGRFEVDARIDLHGLRGAAAREAVRAALLDAAGAGQRCVLVIHGRGQHSQSGPVLREALPSWLAEPPLGGWVMAFASATPADGGSGATYVLLRRRVVRNPG